MSTRERLCQAVLFELPLLALLVPLVAWLGAGGMPVGPEKAFITAIAGSANALVLNYFYNVAFDKWFGAVRIERTVRTRILHAIGFEFSILLTYLPFLMWYLSISFLQALILDIAMVIVVLIYTYLFHLAYDTLRHRYWEKEQ